MNIIEKIRTEIKGITETARNTRINGTTQQAKEADAIIHALDNLMLKISDLEKEEKPIEGLDEEIDKRWKEWLSDDKEQVEGVLPKSEFAFYARHFYELGRQSKKRELLPMIERICASCPEKVKAESALNKFTSNNCSHCSIEHCPGVKACYTSSNKQLQ